MSELYLSISRPECAINISFLDSSFKVTSCLRNPGAGKPAEPLQGLYSPLVLTLEPHLLGGWMIENISTVFCF